MHVRFLVRTVQVSSLSNQRSDCNKAPYPRMRPDISQIMICWHFAHCVVHSLIREDRLELLSIVWSESISN